MTDFLDAGFLSNAGRTTAEMKAGLEQLLTAVKELPGASGPVAVTIAGDAVAVTGPVHIVDTEGGAAADDLRTIGVDGLRDGFCVVLWAASAARKITLKPLGITAVGGMILAGNRDYSLSPDRPILLMKTGLQWKEIMSFGTERAGQGAGARIYNVAGSHNWVVPDGVTRVFASGCGGGGGGGGGGDGANPGGNGGNGGNSTCKGVTIGVGGWQGKGATGSNLGAGLYRGGDGGIPYGHDGATGYTAVAWGSGRGGQRIPSPFGWWGSGGAGGHGVNGGGGGGGGSCTAAPELKKEIVVVPGETVVVTVGAAGGGGAGGGGGAQPGEAGGQGIVILEW